MTKDRNKMYEVELRWKGKKKRPKYLDTEYGFGENPPITIVARNRKEAINQLRLPKNIAIKKLSRVY